MLAVVRPEGEGRDRGGGVVIDSREDGRGGGGVYGFRIRFQRRSHDRVNAPLESVSRQVEEAGRRQRAAIFTCRGPSLRLHCR